MIEAKDATSSSSDKQAVDVQEVTDLVWNIAASLAGRTRVMRNSFECREGRLRLEDGELTMWEQAEVNGSSPYRMHRL